MGLPAPCRPRYAVRMGKTVKEEKIMLVLNTEEMRQAEAAANESGLEYIRLMENAGSAAARVIREHYPVNGRPVVILCGSGNNGGDGFVIARKLLDQNAKVSVVLTGENPRTQNAMEMAQRIRLLPIPVYRWQQDPQAAIAVIQSAQLVVDAVFGIGFRRVLPDSLRGLFRLIGDRRIPVVAVDIPSGMNADSGHCDPDTLRAERTITFTALKPALTMPQTASFCGEVDVADIGIPFEICQKYAGSPTPIEMPMVQECFSSRPADSHKGTFGHVLALCGSWGMAGAAVLSVRGALRCGAGLVTAALPRSIYPMVTAAQPEAVCLPLPQDRDGRVALAARSALRKAAGKVTCLLIGCGLGQSGDLSGLIADLIARAACPVVLDADGINLMAQHIDRVKACKAPLVLTPHPGEMARLCRTTVDEVEKDRAGTARRFAKEYGVWLVLKGHRTLVASPDGSLLVNTTGNPGMATGGSGDVLAGMIASFLAQGMQPQQAAMCGVYLHGRAGDHAAERLGQHAMLPSDLLAELGPLLLMLENRS